MCVIFLFDETENGMFIRSFFQISAWLGDLLASFSFFFSSSLFFILMSKQMKYIIIDDIYDWADCERFGMLIDMLMYSIRAMAQSFNLSPGCVQNGEKKTLNCCRHCRQNIFQEKLGKCVIN